MSNFSKMKRCILPFIAICIHSMNCAVSVQLTECTEDVHCDIKYYCDPNYKCQKCIDCKSYQHTLCPKSIADCESSESVVHATTNKDKESSGGYHFFMIYTKIGLVVAFITIGMLAVFVIRKKRLFLPRFRIDDIAPVNSATAPLSPPPPYNPNRNSIEHYNEKVPLNCLTAYGDRESDGCQNANIYNLPHYVRNAAIPGTEPTNPDYDDVTFPEEEDTRESAWMPIDRNNNTLYDTNLETQNISEGQSSNSGQQLATFNSVISQNQETNIAARSHPPESLHNGNIEDCETNAQSPDNSQQVVVNICNVVNISGNNNIAN